jgi:hypothetical protein
MRFELHQVRALDPADEGAGAPFEHAQLRREPVEGAGVDIERLGGELADRRRRAGGGHQLHLADREQQRVGPLAGLGVGQEQALDVPLERRQQSPERRPAVEARERQVDQEVLRPLLGDACCWAMLAAGRCLLLGDACCWAMLAQA